MSQTRFFYTDPLAAAWMAKHFGMYFHLRDSGVLNKTKSQGKLIDFGRRLRAYVHPHSLPVLKVQLGDIVSMTKAMDRYVLLEIEEMRDAFNEAGDHKIIQRGGKAFIWPESEEAP